MTKVLTFGVFDYFHIGHLNLLRQCREHGDYLIVGVQNGEYVARFKPAQSMLYTTNERVTMIEALRVVDEVFVYDTLCDAAMELRAFTRIIGRSALRCSLFHQRKSSIRCCGIYVNLCMLC